MAISGFGGYVTLSGRNIPVTNWRLKSALPLIEARMLTKKWIISANYRDRNSPKRWLVRREDLPPEAAVAVAHVIAKGVTFQRSSAIEEGFGCRIVAVAESVQLDSVSLKFDGLYSFKDGEGKEHKHVKELELYEDGSILAEPMPV